MPNLTTQTTPSSRERNGFVDFQTMGNTIMGDMVDMGFALVLPTPTAGIVDTTTLAVLEPRAPDANPFTCDPLASDPNLTWRINIDCSNVETANDPGCIRLYVSHPLQIQDNGLVTIDVEPTAGSSSSNPSGSGSSGSSGPKPYTRMSGEITSGWFANGSNTPGGVAASADGIITIPFASKYWNGLSGIDAQVGAITYSYRLTVSNQGFALVIWEEGQEAYGNHFSWIVVQRPVSPSDGTILVTGKQPVFCLYSIGGGEPNFIEGPVAIENVQNPYNRTAPDYDYNPAIYFFTVREVDVYRASVPRLATVDSTDTRLIINGKQQVAITEGNQYVVSFPNGICTDRYMYKEEIDIITYTSGDVISQYSNVSVAVYGEANARQYKAMNANLPDNTGMRILILTYGPGFPTPQ